MRKFILSTAIVAAFGLAASAFAVTNPQCSVETGCKKSDSITQKIHVRVPTVVRLVLDGNVGSKKVDDWNVILTNNDNQDLSSCYVVPNWVGQPGGMSLGDFLNAAGDALLPASQYGYPPIITNESGAVMSWSDVVGANEGLAAVYARFPNAAAKGNLVCKNSFMVEKYTNCPGAAFYVSLDAIGTSPTSGFGDLYINDVTKVNGTNQQVGTASSGAISQTGGSYDLTPAGGFHTGVFYDDYISQMLWLQPSLPGNYRIRATYTLGSGVF